MTIALENIGKLSEKEFTKFKDLIYKNTGIFLKDSKLEMVNSRLLRRLKDLKFSTFDAYYNYLVSDKSGTELLEMINSITTNKTNFFRENNHFEFLYDTLLPEIVQRSFESGDLSLNVWSSACSTGEEPYTISMILKDYFKNRVGWNINLLASDIDTNVIKRAQEGIYNDEQVAPIPLGLLKEYFYKGEGDNKGLFKAKDKLKNIITFKKINLIEDVYPISTPMDIIFCRNVFIYFDQETIIKIINRFYSYLKTGGHMFLGHSETIDLNGVFKDKFKLRSHTVYVKI